MNFTLEVPSNLLGTQENDTILKIIQETVSVIETEYNPALPKDHNIISDKIDRLTKHTQEARNRGISGFQTLSPSKIDELKKINNKTINKSLAMYEQVVLVHPYSSN
jgi:superfamily I DNA and/or RNA helicase